MEEANKYLEKNEYSSSSVENLNLKIQLERLNLKEYATKAVLPKRKIDKEMIETMAKNNQNIIDSTTVILNFNFKYIEQKIYSISNKD